MDECATNRPMKWLRKIREAQGLTQYGMAKKLGLIINTYVHYETKANGINLTTLNRIRGKLGLSWEELGNLIEKEIRENTNKRTNNEKDSDDDGSN